ncbi:hypothetical protein HAX54_039570, partial [Datura stramonium]|nr:hypothetical protein [Datura stramonium]
GLSHPYEPSPFEVKTLYPVLFSSSLSHLNSSMEKDPAKGSHRSSKRLKNSSPSPSPVEFFDSSIDDYPESSSLLKKPSSSGLKKGKIESSISFNLEDMQKLWSILRKRDMLPSKINRWLMTESYFSNNLRILIAL